MEDIRDFFGETDTAFTIYVVEQRFVVGRGVDYFRSFKGKITYIDTNQVMKKRMSGIIGQISKHIPNIMDLEKNKRCQEQVKILRMGEYVLHERCLYAVIRK